MKKKRKVKKNNSSKFVDAKKLGLAGGIIWGVVLFLITLISVCTGYATEFLNLIISIYPGFSITYAGSLVGLVYGFVDGFIALFLLGWIYNGLLKK